MPINVFDIFEDGRATLAQNDALIGDGVYRWWHFDHTEPGLEQWMAKHLPAVPAGALLQPETRPRCDPFEDGLILNLRGVNMNSGQDTEDMVSLRLWVTEKVIVTVRLRKVFAIDDLRTSCENNTAPVTTAAFLVNLVEGLTNRIEQVMLETDEATDAIEETILTEVPLETIQDFGALRQKSIKLRRYLGPQRDAVTKLAAIASPVIDKDSGNLLREPANRTILVVEALDAIKDRLSVVQDFADAKANAKLGRNSYALSVVAAVFLPLGFLTGLFGVNVGGMPGMENPWAFTILTVSMIAISALSLWFIKKFDRF
jgi:zinc transporter